MSDAIVRALTERNRAGDLDAIPVQEEDQRPFLQRLTDFLKQGAYGEAQPGQRGTWVPSQINAQGKPEFAVPGVIQQPAESLQSLMTAPLSDIVRSGDRDAIRAASEASFDVAGALPAAGAAVTKAAPRSKAMGMVAAANPDDPTSAAVTAALAGQDKPKRAPLSTLEWWNAPRYSQNKITDRVNGDGVALEARPGRIDGAPATHYYIKETENGPPVGFVSMVKRDNGMEVAKVELAPEFQGKGLARKAYDLIEQHTGEKMKPSGELSPNGYKMWLSRDADAVANHRRDPTPSNSYLSPKQLIEREKRYSTSALGQRYRDVLDTIPDEAKTPEALSKIFSNPDDPTTAAILALLTAQQGQQQ